MKTLEFNHPLDVVCANCGKPVKDLLKSEPGFKRPYYTLEALDNAYRSGLNQFGVWYCCDDCAKF